MELQAISSIRLAVIAVLAAVTLGIATPASATLCLSSATTMAADDNMANTTIEENQRLRTDENNARGQGERKGADCNEYHGSYGRGYETRQSDARDHESVTRGIYDEGEIK